MKSADLKKIAQIVTEETGNQVKENNFYMLESRLSTYISKLNFKSMDEYWNHFNNHEAQEREVIKGLMTTHYTFFFREFIHFEVVEKWIKSEKENLKSKWIKERKPLKIWSAACSKGHEVYSLAMFLDQLLTDEPSLPFEIVGTDIDMSSIKIAQNGVYPLQEVQTIPKIYLNNYWQKGKENIKDFAAIKKKIKDYVRFEQLNLMDMDLWVKNKSFDIVFCRNVFIYFSPENVKEIAFKISQLIASNGVFVSGLSEPLRFQNWPFKLIGPSSYQKINETSESHLHKEKKQKTVSKASEVPERPQIIWEPKKIEEFSYSYRVLCVDDSKTIQTMMKKIFSEDQEFKDVDIANNGKEAFEKLKKNKYDIITLDIHMPEVNGIEFLEKYYDSQVDPPVIMVSSVNRSDLDLATKSLHLGAFDYVEKPALNNLAKSTEEILTKAKMAIRFKQNHKKNLNSFDDSFSKHVVIPDASQCLRIIWSGVENKKYIEEILKEQNKEQRSPPCLLVEDSSHSSLEKDLFHWTKNKIVNLKIKQSLKPDHLYLIQNNSSFLKSLEWKFKMVSLQILNFNHLNEAQFLSFIPMLQILLDDTLVGNQNDIEYNLKKKISNIAPPISFASLSAEFFAQIQKAAV